MDPIIAEKNREIARLSNRIERLQQRIIDLNMRCARSCKQKLDICRYCDSMRLIDGCGICKSSLFYVAYSHETFEKDPCRNCLKNKK